MGVWAQAEANGRKYGIEVLEGEWFEGQVANKQAPSVLA